jgi:uncharacterized protein
MKFQPDTLDGVNAITRQEAACVWVGSMPYRHSVLVPGRGAVLPWSASVWSELTAAHFEAIAGLQPEVVIFGSGSRLRFLPPALLRGLYERRIGIETMDTAAACRTYNVLVAEGRAVLAALLIEPST